MLPLLEEYLAKLPLGMGSHPTVMSKAAIFRSAAIDSGLARRLQDRDVPAPLLELMRNPPTVNDWVPEVYSVAATCAVYDVVFRDAGGLAAFEQWVLERNRKLLGSPLYRVLFLVMSPERLFSNLDRRWGAFHRGSTLAPVTIERGRAEVELTYPAYLFSSVYVKTLGRAFQAAGEAAGAKDLSFRIVHETSSSTRYEMVWRAGPKG